MKNKLNEIIENKRKEVEKKKEKRDFFRSITNPKMGGISLFAEIKLISPSAGKLGDINELEERVIMYEKSSADVISLVVDKKYFDGDLDFIKRAKKAVSLPILAKDFIIDPYQIYEMKFYGADAVLLIAKILQQQELIQFVELCFDIGLEPVVEVQNMKELDNAINTETRIIAVNARNLDSFEVDVDKACGLLKLIPKKYVTLGFSGVFGRKEIEKYRKAGVRGVLVGTNLMKLKDSREFIKELKGI